MNAGGGPKEPSRRVLYVSYAFPPVGGAGVQRSLKFVKYLPQVGWIPTVLTVANPSVPVVDPQLLNDIDGGTTVVRARSWEPGYGLKRLLISKDGAPATASTDDSVEGLQKLEHRARTSWRGLAKPWLRSLARHTLHPDPQVLWNGPAFRQAARLLRLASRSGNRGHRNGFGASKCCHQYRLLGDPHLLDSSKGGVFSSRLRAGKPLIHSRAHLHEAEGRSCGTDLRRR